MLFKRAGGQGGEDGEGRDDANANVDGVDELKEAVGDKTWNRRIFTWNQEFREIYTFVCFEFECKQKLRETQFQVLLC